MPRNSIPEVYFSTASTKRSLFYCMKINLLKNKTNQLKKMFLESICFPKSRKSTLLKSKIWDIRAIFWGLTCLFLCSTRKGLWEVLCYISWDMFGSHRPEAGFLKLRIQVLMVSKCCEDWPPTAYLSKSVSEKLTK